MSFANLLLAQLSRGKPEANPAKRDAQRAFRVAPVLVIALICSSASTGQAEGTVRILPGRIQLDGRHAEHGFLVERTSEADAIGQVPATEYTATVEDENIARLDAGRLVPVQDGQTRLIVRTPTGQATAQIVVRGQQRPVAWSFRQHVLPVLAKAGCNSGACHGALAGKGGFRLSLRGYDPKSDHYTITRQDRGRRVELADPGRSLFLAKPSGAIPHKGGLRFDVGSREYRVLSEWIQAGTPAPADHDPELTQLEVTPNRVVLQPGAAQSVLVRAHYSDGTIEDVTRWVKFASTNEAVASIDQQGEISVVGFGEGAITAWFSSQIVIARVTVPYEHQIDDRSFESATKRNFIDDLVLKQLRRLNLKPSPDATDSQFIRRVFLDTIGTLPTIEEVERFAADAREDKRDRLIDELLERPEFVDYWTYKWSDLLLINGQLLRPEAVKAYYQWIHDEVAQNRPWDEFVQRIVTARGSSLDNGATNFFALHQSPEDMTENTSQAFLGLSIGCARCHNHPLEKWTNNQYYAMANLFARVRAKGWGGDSRNGDGKRTLVVLPRGDLIQPLTGKPQPPTPLDGEPLAFDDESDRRLHLAQWLTSPENPYFARAITNRVWANFMGVGLVEPIDDLRASNPASNAELLQRMAEYLTQQDFDLKALMRLILQSKTYQRSSQALPENQAERRFYSRYYPRRLMAEVLLDAISTVTGVDSRFEEIEFPGADVRKTDFYPAGTRAIQLYDSAVKSYFLRTFGRNQRRITCECERSDEPSMVQVLHLSNGVTINEKLAAKECRLQQQLDREKPITEAINEIYLAALSRKPSDDERRRLSEFFATAETESERREILEDLYWSVLTSREFLFNH